MTKISKLTLKAFIASLESAKGFSVNIFASIAAGWLSYQYAGKNLPLSIIIGLYSSILLLLISNKKEFNRFWEEALSRLAGFGNINSSLIEIEKYRTQSSENDGLEILKSFESSLDEWKKKLCSDDKDQRDLWMNVFALYLKEERNDLSSYKIATNIGIYVHLLMQAISYHIDSYNDKAVVVILTSILPGEWYKWPSHLASARRRVEEYRETLTKYIEKKRIAKIFPDFSRYIILRESNGKQCGFKSKNDLFNEFHRSHTNKYVDELHFEPGNAKYFTLEKYGRDFPEDYRDLILFGRKREDGSIDWRWGIQSDMDPSFPVMFMRFYDAGTIYDPKAFANCDINTFVEAIRGNSDIIV